MKLLLIIFFTLNVALNSFGQSRSFLRSKIEEWGECKNVAMTLTGGDVALYGTNGWAGNGLPADMVQELHELNEDDKLIDDVQLTESGSWLILWGDNGISWNNIPWDLEIKLREFNDEGEIIASVTFNDSGDWIVITTKRVAASSSIIYDWIAEGLDEYGSLWSAHITEDGAVLCYSGGYKFFGNVPFMLKSKLEETQLDVYRIKFLSDGTYFIADKYGSYDYYF